MKRLQHAQARRSSAQFHTVVYCLKYFNQGDRVARGPATSERNIAAPFSVIYGSKPTPAAVFCSRRAHRRRCLVTSLPVSRAQPETQVRMRKYPIGELVHVSHSLLLFFRVSVARTRRSRHHRSRHRRSVRRCCSAYSARGTDGYSSRKRQAHASSTRTVGCGGLFAMLLCFVSCQLAWLQT